MDGVTSEVAQLIRAWEEEHTNGQYDPLPTLTRLAEIIEAETENYLKMDPDPFDERHPSRADPTCKLGQILKLMFKKELFTTKLLNDYLRDTYYSRLALVGYDADVLNTAACRLMLDIMPGLEVSVVFTPNMESLILRLFKWAAMAAEPLKSYAIGLLAAAMENTELATKYRDSNAKLVPLLLQRLKQLQIECDFVSITNLQPVNHFGKSPKKDVKGVKNKENGVSNVFKRKETSSISENTVSNLANKRQKVENHMMSPPRQMPRTPVLNESSNSSWAEMESFMIGSIQMHPITPVTTQVLILRYLEPMGEYQEFLSHVFEHNALQLILNYVNVRETKQARLAFEALRYLASLLCHMKFSLEFIHYNGLQVLLDVPRPSIAATGVSICIYYLGYCDEAMDRVCLLPKATVSKLVNYALWLLECSHDSGRCHATMFFGLTFKFKVILDEFDAQDGLRKLHNLIATLPIFSNDAPPLNEDAECAARQVVRHVCVAFKRYLESHLISKIEQLQRAQLTPPDRLDMPPLPAQNSYKSLQARKSSPEDIQQHIEILMQYMPFKTHWAPIDNLLKLGGITLLLKIIAFAYEWNYSGRAETVRGALDALAIACVMPKVQLLLCERVDLPEDSITLGMSIILGAAEGEIVRDADVLKSAIRVLINCVCGPLNRVCSMTTEHSLFNVASMTTAAVNSPNKKTKVKNSEDLLQKMWDCVRANSGIMVLLQLINIKTPITDADCIRTLACKALNGLARCDTVRQIVSKLPIFQCGHLQNLMRDPILQEKRQEHVTFQKYALELLGRLSGRTTSADTVVSVVNIHRASVVAQTNISFNDKQLMHLIYQHLQAKGCSESAKLLIKEANLTHLLQQNTISTPNHPSKFRYTSESPVTPRGRLSAPHPSSSSLRSNSNTSFNDQLLSQPSTSTSTPNKFNNSQAIKLVRKNSLSTTPVTAPNSRLQKQITCDSITKVVTTADELPVVELKVTLDSIITEYLANQHALCKNPMATCPQFNLFEPHKCPDPKPRIASTANVVTRLARKQIGYPSNNLDRRLVNSRFCPVQSMRYPNVDDGFFTCARFMPGDQSVIVGDYSGEVRIYNIHTGNEEVLFPAHDSYLIQIEPNRTGELLVTSSAWRSPLSALWELKDFKLIYTFDVQDYVEFSKLTQDKIIGTKGEVATIYDVRTGQEIHRFIPSIHNQYTKNKATFSHNDEQILTDGVLFDVNSGKPIRKLDKLNQTQSGVFHPNGREIIANCEIWDMRTFHLLKTVQELNQCNVTFAKINNAIFACSMEQEDMDGDRTFESSFKTIDAMDYSSIATIDVKRTIYDLAVNNYNNQIAIVENQGAYFSVQESVVRVYDVGRRRDVEDDQDEDEDEDDEDRDDISEDASDVSENLEDSNALDALGEGDGDEDDNFGEEDESFSLGSDDTYTDLSDGSLGSTSDEFGDEDGDDILVL